MIVLQRTAQGTYADTISLIRCSITGPIQRAEAGPGDTERRSPANERVHTELGPCPTKLLPLNKPQKVKPVVWRLLISCVSFPIIHLMGEHLTRTPLNLLLIFRSQTMMYLIASFLREALHLFIGFQGPSGLRRSYL